MPFHLGCKWYGSHVDNVAAFGRKPQIEKNAALCRDAATFSLHRIHQRRQPLNPHFQPVARFDRPDAAGRAGEQNVAGQERHVGRDEADQVVAVEDELARVRVLAQLPVLKELDRQMARVDLRFHIRSQRCERVERLCARPLAFAVLDGAIADVLGGGVPKNVAGRGGGRHVARPPSDDDAEFRLEIRAVVRKGDFDLSTVGNERRGGFKPEQGLLGQWLPALARVVCVVETDGDDLRRNDRRERSHAFR